MHIYNQSAKKFIAETQFSIWLWMDALLIADSFQQKTYRTVGSRLRWHLTSTTRWRMWGPYHLTRSTCCIETSQHKPEAKLLLSVLHTVKQLPKNSTHARQIIPSDCAMLLIELVTYSNHDFSSESLTFSWTWRTPPSALHPRVHCE